MPSVSLDGQFVFVFYLNVGGSVHIEGFTFKSGCI